LKPAEIRIPKGTLLHPSENAAVVGGNVLTSQRVVDVVFKAFGACAASQGCMNNLTFGDSTFGYYETIAGGAGAGPGWEGRSGVHTGMTNTRITDVEVFERRYPIVTRCFSLRKGSGGPGQFRGGDGVVREIQFRKPLHVSILSERRITRPYGMAGGGPGARGRNILVRSDGRSVNLGGKNTVLVAPGECLRIETPGAGGFGAPIKGEDNLRPPVGVEEEEFLRAVAQCEGRNFAWDGTAHGEDVGTVQASDSSGSAAMSAAFLFSGAVGRYKEAQESV
jgi:5-oxoprolinase (ATP-hydrolysing)